VRFYIHLGCRIATFSIHHAKISKSVSLGACNTRTIIVSRASATLSNCRSDRQESGRGWYNLEAMLAARRKCDGQTVLAYDSRKHDGPFACVECGGEVNLKDGQRKVNHFAHVTPLPCRHSINESDAHRKCKMEIFEALRNAPGVSDVTLEKPMGTGRIRTMFEMVEAAGVEPASLANIPAATTCLVRKDFLLCDDVRTRVALPSPHEICRRAARGLRVTPRLQWRSSSLAGVSRRTSQQLGRES
jgi:hypothetical protein